MAQKYIGDLQYPLNYINKSGLEELEVFALKEFLEELQLTLGDVWKPDLCTFIPAQAKEMNIARELTKSEKNSFGQYFGEIISKRYLRNHFFSSTILQRNNEIVIIDPTGVPEDITERFNENWVLPYFGLLNEAPENHIKTYSNARDLDKFGAKLFPSTINDDDLEKIWKANHK